MVEMDERVAEPDAKGSGKLILLGKDPSRMWIKELNVSAGKLTDRSDNYGGIKYLGFSFANAFDNWVKDNIPSPKHVVITRILQSGKAVEHLEHTFAGQYANNHDDDGWDDINEIKDRNTKSGDGEVFGLEVNWWERSSVKQLYNLHFMAFKASANADAMSMKLLLA